MTDYNPGDVVLIPFPFTDLSTVKQRPAIILSSLAFNQRHQDAILAAITSHVPEVLTSDEYLGFFAQPPKKVYSGGQVRNAPDVRQSLQSHMGLRMQEIHSFEPQTLP